MRRSFLSEAAADEEGAIDLTPMLDVVFIMLIFFIVTATFIKESGIEVNRPEASTANQKDDTTVLIAISADNSIWMDKRRIDIRSVKANVERLVVFNIQAYDWNCPQHITQRYTESEFEARTDRSRGD